MTESERQIIELLTQIRDNGHKALAANKEATDENNRQWQASQKAAEESARSWAFRWLLFFAVLSMVLGIALVLVFFVAV